jgi:glycosyltransferase involved in cell wall biosynthesis
MTKVLHIISGLNVGGAETFLLRLIPSLQRAGYRSSVIYLSGEGGLAADYRKAGIEVYPCRLDRGVRSVVGLYKLMMTVRAQNPDLIQTWMYHADFFGCVAGWLLKKPVFWGVRQSNLSRELNKRRTLFVVRLCSLLSRYRPVKIIYNANSARLSHEKVGYDSSRSEVIHNGIDCEKFTAATDACKTIRRELDIAPDALVIGHIARYDLQKDHASFLEAIKMVIARFPEVHVLLAGKGVTWSNQELFSGFDQAKDDTWLHPLGHRVDIPDLLASVDVFCSSSRGESFPNAVLEAMASGLPCVVTNAGDVSALVGEFGIVVKPETPSELATGCSRLLSQPPDFRRRLGNRARQRVLDYFSLETSAARFAQLYGSCLRKLSSRGDSH